MDGLEKVGQGAKVGAEEVGRFFRGIGDGIQELGRHLTGG